MALKRDDHSEGHSLSRFKPRAHSNYVSSSKDVQSNSEVVPKTKQDIRKVSLLRYDTKPIQTFSN